ncbi:MAG: Holliday junction branch migration DNA helicase RuvB [Patescibacteria group bacterium]
MDQPTITAQSMPEEVVFEETLRPSRLADYIGQKAVKENLRIAMMAAQGRGETLEHVLIHGAPGLGKTTLAAIVAHEMGSNLRVTSGPAIERAGDLASILTNLEAGDVLFIDEIHRLSRVIEEVLYPAMEDYMLDLVIGKGPAARTVRLDLPKFTLVGATTRIGAMSSPLRDRFGVIHSLEFYDVSEMEEIIRRSAKILGIAIEAPALTELARRSRRTPRIANRLLKRVRDYAQVEGSGIITLPLAKHALDRLEIDALGLDRTDRKIISTIASHFGGGPVGIDTIAASTNEDRDTIETVVEPYLLQIGFLKRTPKGRVLTPAAAHHLGLKIADQNSEQRLFA